MTADGRGLYRLWNGKRTKLQTSVGIHFALVFRCFPDHSRVRVGWSPDFCQEFEDVGWTPGFWHG